MGKLVIIDGNAIMHRAYHALPKSLTDKKGELTNAVYGFTSMLLRIVEDLGPSHLVICFDRKEPTFRKKLDVNYQATRPKMEKGLSGQFSKVKELMMAMGIPMYDKEGFEADDLLGTLSRKATEISSKKTKGNSTPIDEVVIVTGDRDILQLVGDRDRVRVYLPISGLSEGKLFEEKDVVEKMGVKPSQIVDYKALVGDPSDNYKGVSGIGPKTAVKLINDYKNLDEIYRNLDGIDKSISERLRSGEESARLSHKLAQIVTDVDINFDLSQSGKWSLDSEQVENVYEKLSFRTLAKRTKELAKKFEKEKQGNLFE